MENTIKILLVEDDFIMILAGKTTFQSLGCQVDVAENGQEAVHLSSTQVYDLIIMDLGLGETTGYAVTEQIRTNSMNTKTPVIALTVYSAMALADDCFKVGMNDVKTKPLIPNDAVKIIKKFVQRKPLKITDGIYEH